MASVRPKHVASNFFIFLISNNNIY